MIGKYGRRSTMYISAAVFTAGYVLMVCAQNVTYLYIGRLFCGIASGLTSVSAPTYVAEIASPQVRGLLGSCFQVSLNTNLKLIYFWANIFEKHEINCL